MASGKVKWWNNKKGFGFISQDTGQDVLVHHTAILGEGVKDLNEGDEVTFDEAKADVVDTTKSTLEAIATSLQAQLDAKSEPGAEKIRDWRVITSKGEIRVLRARSPGSELADVKRSLDSLELDLEVLEAGLADGAHAKALGLSEEGALQRLKRLYYIEKTNIEQLREICQQIEQGGTFQRDMRRQHLRAGLDVRTEATESKSYEFAKLLLNDLQLWHKLGSENARGVVEESRKLIHEIHEYRQELAEVRKHAPAKEENQLSPVIIGVLLTSFIVALISLLSFGRTYVGFGLFFASCLMAYEAWVVVRADKRLNG